MIKLLINASWLLTFPVFLAGQNTRFYASVNVLDGEVISEVFEENDTAYKIRTGAASFSCGFSQYRDVASCVEAKSEKKTTVGNATLFAIETNSTEETYRMIIKVSGIPMITIGKSAILRIDAKNALYLVDDNGKAHPIEVLRKEALQKLTASPPEPAPIARQTVTELRVFSLPELEGAIVLAHDGKPLGLITIDCFESNAICNERGPYGDKSRGDSMLNGTGSYGSTVSLMSPFNNSTARPPGIFKDGKFIAYLTTNDALSPRVDPRWLLGALKMTR